MSKGVFTRMKRVEFMEKTAGEVGDGTAWPMLVTLDELAEILYRVKDAWFTGGSVATTAGEEPSAGLGLSMEGGTPPDEYISGSGSGLFYIRGYTWWGPYNYDLEHEQTDNPLLDGEDMNVLDQPYFGDGYNGGLLPNQYETPPYYFPEDYLADFFPATVDPTGYICRDVGGNERTIWLPENAVPTSRINGLTLRTAFSQEMACSGAGAGYLIDHPAPSQLRLEIYPEVAWVDENASGNPYDPANKLYLKLRFGVLGTASPYDIVALDTMPDSGFRSYVYATDLVFELADSSPTAKIYFYEEYDGEEAASFASASPFTLTAQEWWPYAKGSPAEPVWDSETGVKL
jgi:hypothetical protein